MYRVPQITVLGPEPRKVREMRERSKFTRDLCTDILSWFSLLFFFSLFFKASPFTCTTNTCTSLRNEQPFPQICQGVRHPSSSPSHSLLLSSPPPSLHTNPLRLLLLLVVMNDKCVGRSGKPPTPRHNRPHGGHVCRVKVILLKQGFEAALQQPTRHFHVVTLLLKRHSDGLGWLQSPLSS